jgi:hypothetical protein
MCARPPLLYIFQFFCATYDCAWPRWRSAKKATKSGSAAQTFSWWHESMSVGGPRLASWWHECGWAQAGNDQERLFVVFKDPERTLHATHVRVVLVAMYHLARMLLLPLLLLSMLLSVLC